jgi:hypothetical protein
VVTAMQTETAYINMSKSMSELLWLCQQGDAFADGKIKEITSLLEDKAKHSPWHVDDDDLLRNNGTMYIPLDKAL